MVRHSPVGPAPIRDAPPSAPRASPSARRRSRRRTAAAAPGRTVKSALSHPNTGQQKVIVPRNCATGVQAARRLPAEVTACRRPPIHGALWMIVHHPPFRASRFPIRPPAVAATDRGRRAPGLAAGIGRREARYATHPGAGGYRPAQLRYGRAGCASASR